jgi:hypothetical protein
MSVRSLSSILALAALIGYGGVVAYAAEDGFEPLFDGKSFEGLTGMGGNPLPSEDWVIEDGTIRTQGAHAAPAGEGRRRGRGRARRFGGDLRTAAEYSDFDLRFEWKISEGGNSGIKYNVQEEWINDRFRPNMSKRQKAGLKGRAIGFEYQISDDSLWDRSHDDWAKSASGALYLIKWADAKPLKPVGEWNTSRIVVKGNHGEHWLNGEKLFEFEMGSEEMLAQVEKTKFRKMPGYGLKGPGPIVLTHHGSPAWYRNLRIRAEEQPVAEQGRGQAGHRGRGPR